MQSFIVEKIEFDFTDSFGTITEQEQEFITDNTLGVWHVTEEDELVDFITDSVGWCVKSIKYCKNRPHPLTSYMYRIVSVRGYLPHGLNSVAILSI